MYTMESVTLSYTTDYCFICREFMGSFKNELSVVTGYSEKPIHELIELFTNVTLTRDILDEAGICQNCFVKINDFDEHQTIASHIRAELTALFTNSSDPIDVKFNVKSEQYEYQESIYEEVEETQNEPIVDDMFDEPSEEQDVNGDDFNVVEYDWTESEDVQCNVTARDWPYLKPKPSKSKPKTTDADKQWQCEVCLRYFKEKSKLKSHREIHTNERNIICPVCGKSFKTQACLRSHKRVHNPVYLACDYCGKNYTQKPELAKHIKFVHFNIREFACETCGAGFGSKGHLSTHLLTHQGNLLKKSVCSICQMAFHTRAKLERHLKSHTGERNYECGICGKKFLYSYNVTAHIKHVHYREKRRNTDTTCTICGKKFQKIWKLKEHLAELHNAVETLEAMTEEDDYFKQ